MWSNLKNVLKFHFLQVKTVKQLYRWFSTYNRNWLWFLLEIIVVLCWIGPDFMTISMMVIKQITLDIKWTYGC